MKILATAFLLCFASLRLGAEVLVVADEFPAMQVLTERLRAEEGVTSRLVEQDHLPESLQAFSCVAVYIHKDLMPAAERAFIEYAESGGRLVLLHHSISSGKRKNRDWFTFLGIELPEGKVSQGGYQWIEDVSVEWINLAPAHYVMTHRIEYPRVAPGLSTVPNSKAQTAPSFELRGTEVYLNHVLKGPHHIFMGLRYVEKGSGQVWQQSTAGWDRPTGKGRVIYFMPGHTSRDFESPVYGRIVLNAITASPDKFP